MVHLDFKTHHKFLHGEKGKYMLADSQVIGTSFLNIALVESKPDRYSAGGCCEVCIHLILILTKTSSCMVMHCSYRILSHPYTLMKPVTNNVDSF